MERAHATVVLEPEGVAATTAGERTSFIQWIGYFAVGGFLGIVFVKSEVVSWYRIQEMFRFDSFHLYGVIGSALAVASIALWIMRRANVRTIAGDPISVPAMAWGSSGRRFWMGGFVFGLGWALLGACPGPIFALIGAGHLVYLVPLAAATAGTYAYAVVREALPHD
jgi:uncharacterized membrane protein YedE/YeeE